MINILCTIKGFTSEAKTVLEDIGSLTCIIPTQNELVNAVSEAEVLLVQLGLTVNRDVIDAAPSLRIIATATTGLDHIDITYAEEKGITIVSLKGETAFLETITSTSELALGLMIALARHIPSAVQSVLAGTWNREGNRGSSLSGKTLGIIGMGRLGTLMATYAKGLGMNVLHTDPAVDGGIPLETLLKQADVISVHVHLTTETTNLINANTLKHMKSGALLINTARGKIVDEAAVIEALESGHLGGYATDVLGDELSFTSDSASAPLIEYAKNHRNVIITPHIGGTTTESREATDVFIAKKICNHL